MGTTATMAGGIGSTQQSSALSVPGAIGISLAQAHIAAASRMQGMAEQLRALQAMDPFSQMQALGQMQGQMQVNMDHSTGVAGAPAQGFVVGPMSTISGHSSGASGVGPGSQNGSRGGVAVGASFAPTDREGVSMDRKPSPDSPKEPQSGSQEGAATLEVAATEATQQATRLPPPAPHAQPVPHPPPGAAPGAAAPLSGPLTSDDMVSLASIGPGPSTQMQVPASVLLSVLSALFEASAVAAGRSYKKKMDKAESKRKEAIHNLKAKARRSREQGSPRGGGTGVVRNDLAVQGKPQARRPAVQKTPHSDEYKWRKYGQKVIRHQNHNNAVSRDYYRCSPPNGATCDAKKQVEYDAQGQIVCVRTTAHTCGQPPALEPGPPQQSIYPGQ